MPGSISTGVGGGLVLDGGVAKSEALLFDPMREALASHAGLDFLAGLPLYPPSSGATPGWQQAPACPLAARTEEAAARTHDWARRRALAVPCAARR